MTPLEFRNELTAIRAMGRGGAERLDALARKVETALGPKEPPPLFPKEEAPAFLCARCKNVRENERDFPDRLIACRLRIGSGEDAEVMAVTPFEAAILDRLIPGRGKLQSWETLIFHVCETGVRRPGQERGESDNPRNVLGVMVCKLRKKLRGLKHDVRIETRWGYGLVLVSDDEIVLEI